MEAIASTVPTTEQLREKATQVKRDLRELGSTAKDVAADKFDHWYQEGRERMVRLEKGLENTIREHPLQAVLIAAGAGFLAGMLIGRRR